MNPKPMNEISTDYLFKEVQDRESQKILERARVNMPELHLPKDADGKYTIIGGTVNAVVS